MKKVKNFRYLGKSDVKNPNVFLHAVVQCWGLNWSKNFNFLVNSSLYPPLRDPDFEYNFTQHHLGQMVEMAYIILRQCGLQPLPDYRPLAGHNRLFETGSSEAIDPEKTIQYFFGFKKLDQWYEVLCELQLSRDITNIGWDHIPLGPECLLIRDLLTDLPLALLEIHKRGGMQHRIPCA